ncbi:MAG: hypothetical protein V4749_08555 [Pseudomonadota bacterium]
MDVLTFIRLCDTVVEQGVNYDLLDSKEVYLKLQGLYRGKLNEIRKIAGALRKHLAIKEALGEAVKDPYLSFLSTIFDATNGTDADAEDKELPISWEEVVAAAYCGRESLHWFKDYASARFDDRETSLGSACAKLKSQNVLVEIDGLEVVIPKHAYKFVGQRINKLAVEVGGVNILESVFRFLAPQFNQDLGRYLIYRTVSNGLFTVSPATPWGYLIAIGVRHLHDNGEGKAQEGFFELVAFVQDLITVFEIQPYSVWEVPFLGGDGLVGFLRETVLYDNLIAVSQISGRHARLIINDITKIFIAEKHSSEGVYLKVVCAIALSLIDLSSQKRISKVSLDDVARRSGVRKDLALEALSKVLSFSEGTANQELAFPPSSEKIDTNFKPAFCVGKQFLLLPRPLTAMAALNAVLNMISRPGGKQNDGLEIRLGVELEKFINDQISLRSIPVYSGDIVAQAKKSVGECDAVVDTNEVVFFMEVKKKALTRKAMAGVDYQLLIDLGDSLLRSHVQAYKAEAQLRKQGVISLKDKTGKVSTIALLGKEVERVSVSLADFGGFQSRSVLQSVLGAVVGIDVNASDPKIDLRLDKWREWTHELRRLMAEDNTLADGNRRAFYNSSFMSVPQILTILENCTSADEFQQEMCRGRFILSGYQDFYKEYIENLAYKSVKT